MDMNLGSVGGDHSGLNRPVKSPGTSEEVQHSHRDVGASRTSDTQAPASAPAVTPSPDTEQATQPAVQTQVRPLTEQDVVDQILHLKKQPTADAKQIVSALLQYGAEVNAGNIDMIETFIKGKNKKGRLIESAAVAIAKGLSQNAKAVSLLHQFFNNQMQFSEQLGSLKQALSGFSQLMGKHEELFGKGLFSGLGALISDLDESLKKMTKKKGGLDFSALMRSGMIKNLHLFHGFLGGLAEKLGQQNPNAATLKAVLDQLSGLRSGVGGMLDNLLAQLILSKQFKDFPMDMDQFKYWQLPNFMVASPKNIDLLIRQDKSKVRDCIDPKNTRIVIRMETDDLGEITIMIDITDTKVRYLFKTSQTQTKQFILDHSKQLKSRMEELNYEVVAIKTTMKKIDVKKLLLPTFNLDNLNRIVTEV